LVYASLSGFGQTGPYRDRAGHDLNYVALAGLLGYNVDHALRPVMPGVQVADLGCGTLAAVGILAALFSARSTGVGQIVDVSLFASAVTWLPVLLAAPLKPGEPRLSGGLAQYGIYATADGRYVTLGALEPKFLANFLSAVHRADLLGVDNATLRTELTAIFATRTLAQWVADLDRVDTCFAPVNTLEEALADPQAQALGMFADGQIAPPFAMSGTPATIRHRAPRLGEHNAEILEPRLS
jgi:crotonobetainyl-CoA:carnitine CoA-transferase CaiB-like acyl-CoA transferase